MRYRRWPNYRAWRGGEILPTLDIATFRLLQDAVKDMILEDVKDGKMTIYAGGLALWALAEKPCPRLTR